MEKYFNERGYEFKKKAMFAGVNAATGDYEVFNETLSNSDKVNGIMTSAAIPFAFPSIHWNYDGDELVGIDGGSVWNLNLASAIQRCKEVVGDDETKITIDILDCSTHEQPPYKGSGDQIHTIDSFMRYKNLKDHYEGGVADIQEIMAAFPKVHYRHYVSPSQTLPTMAVMDGTNSTCTWPMQMLGRKDGANVVNKGDGYHHKKILEWRNSKELQAKWPKIADYIVHLNKKDAVPSKADPITFDCKVTFGQEQKTDE